MATRLLADQTQFLHQSVDFEATNHDTIFSHHAYDAAATSRTSALNKQFMNAAT
ncbi:hypothetical protein LT85_2024 [Collimonas arenae]|uniref:Uncharacterized protein n=1 Tax=Collimonas arenae TaxID=279058 RepID=A0A0A1FEA1_9BURK|nr:hypothetical protein LT85_2024 [Collimonas arenae]